MFTNTDHRIYGVWGWWGYWLTQWWYARHRSRAITIITSGRRLMEVMSGWHESGIRIPSYLPPHTCARCPQKGKVTKQDRPVMRLLLYSSIIHQHHSSASFISIIHQHHSSVSFIRIIHQDHSSRSFIRIMHQHHSSAKDTQTEKWQSDLTGFLAGPKNKLHASMIISINNIKGNLCLQGAQLTYTGFQCILTSFIMLSSLRPASDQVAILISNEVLFLQSRSQKLAAYFQSWF